jgi:hypothetical protein
MNRKPEFIFLNLSEIDFSTPAFTEAARIEEQRRRHNLAIEERWRQCTIPIEMRLAETIDWCLPLANPLFPRTSLRGDSLKPTFAYNESEYQFYSSSFERIFNMGILQDTRSRLLDGENIPLGSHKDLQGGKLLAYFPDESVIDGASEVASKGFFDAMEVPPWDTWVGFFREYKREFIVSYVPMGFIEFAQAGIDVNCVECIQWLEDTQTNLAKDLLNKGIIR